jgi:hypothetical protein
MKYKFASIAMCLGALVTLFTVFFGQKTDDLNDYYHLYSKRYDRTIYVSKNDTSSHLIWTGDTLTFQSK